jgi:prephenate dehydrogenase
MAGKEGRGARAAEASLFDGRPYVLTPLDPADLEHEAVGEFQGWLRRIGARAVVLEPGLHDRLVALVSHLPQLASTALAASLADRPEKNALRDVVGPGVLDMTRLALSPYQIWSDIIATNQASIVAALDSYIERLLLLRTGLGSPATAAMFEKAASLAAGLRRPAPARPNESGLSSEGPL